MKITLITLVLSFTASGLFAQLTPSKYPKAVYSDLSYIAAEGNYIYTVGDCDVFMFSTNGGLDWEIIEVTDNTYGLEIMPGSMGKQALLLSSNKVLRFDSATKAITNISTPFNFLNQNLRHMYVDQDRIYVQSNTSVYSANTAALQWSALGNAQFANDTDFLVFGDLGAEFIYLGSSQGRFQRMDKKTGAVTVQNEYGARISHIDMVNDNLGYMDVSGQTFILKTTDGGKNWSSLTNMPENIHPVAYGDNVVFSLNTNRLYVSKDGGATSTYVDLRILPNVDLLSDAYFTKEGKLYFAGQSNVILSSDDFGSTMTNLNDYNRSSLLSIDFSGNEGYAVGENGTVLTTVNKGEEWQIMESDDFGDRYFNAVSALGGGRFILASESGSLLVEGQEVTVLSDAPMRSLQKSANSQYLMSIQERNGNPVIAKSTDNGMNWATKYYLPENVYAKFHQSPTGSWYLPAGDETVFVSHDGGENWETKNFGIDGIAEVYFLDADHGIFSAGQNLYKTSNGGVNALQITTGYLIRNVQYFNKNQILYTTSQNNQTTVRMSENGGTTFSTIASFCTPTFSSYYDGKKQVWLAQDGGHINVIEVVNTTSVENASIAAELSVYPNPVQFGQHLVLNGAADLEGGMVRVSNLLGQTVLQKVVGSDGDLGAMELNPGTYFMEVTTGSKFRKVLPIVVVR